MERLEAGSRTCCCIGWPRTRAASRFDTKLSLDPLPRHIHNLSSHIVNWHKYLLDEDIYIQRDFEVSDHELLIPSIYGRRKQAMQASNWCQQIAHKQIKMFTAPWLVLF